MVLPNQNLADLCENDLGFKWTVPFQWTRKICTNRFARLNFKIGNLPQALAEADVAIASTGTVTMECAFFGVPTVTLYKTSWSTYQIAKRIVKVKWLTMPNILADEEIYPEFVQMPPQPGILPEPRWNFCKTNRAAFKSKSGWRKSFRPWRPRRDRAGSHGNFEFVPMILSSSFSSFMLQKIGGGMETEITSKTLIPKP